MELFECVRLRARISQRQCGVNRNGYHNPRGGVKLSPIATCQGCEGLGGLAHVPIPKEDKVNHKKFMCSHKGCARAVKKEGDACWQHKGLADQVEAGVVASELPSGENLASVVIGADGPVIPVTEQGKGAELDHFTAMSLGDDTESLNGAPAQRKAEPEIAPVASTPPQEQVDPCVLPSSPAIEGTKGIAALLRAPTPPPVGLLIPFAKDELAALEESEVTPEVIREFILMGFEGKLQINDAAA